MGDASEAGSTNPNHASVPSVKMGRQMAAISKGRSKIKPAPGRNLLPSKMGSSSSGSSGGALNVSKTSGIRPVKPRHMAAKPSIPKPSESLDTAYDSYLQGLFIDSYVEEIGELQALEKGHVLVMQHAELASLDTVMNKVLADKVIVSSFDQLSLVNKLENCFDDLVDFTGDETLVEIQSILARKFDKIFVEGATMSPPIFKENVIENLIEKLKSTFQDQEKTDTMLGFCLRFAEALNNLAAKTEIIGRKNSDLQIYIKTLLENCSLQICNLAQSVESVH